MTQFQKFPRIREVARIGQEINHDLPRDLITFFENLNNQISSIFKGNHFLLLSIYQAQTKTLAIYQTEQGHVTYEPDYKFEGANRYIIANKTPLFIRQRSKEVLPFEIESLDRQNFAYPTYTCPTHGDFNQHNLQTDSDGHIWMIDFQGTGQGHILRDFVALDTTLRFQLLTTSEATLQERLEMDLALCSINHFSEVDQLEGKFQTNNPNLTKAYAILVHLRKLAYHMVRHNPSDDFNEYYAALLLNSLNTLRFTSLEQEQRVHALLSASLLAKKLQTEI